MALGFGLAQWVPQSSNSGASLRGVSAVDARVAWASGANATILKTEDGGVTWGGVAAPSGAEALDFRSIQAFDAKRAYVMSVGPGGQSRIYKTLDGGAHWSLGLQNSHASGFFDAIAFWSFERGVAVGDAVDGRMFVALTSDGGKKWEEVDGGHIPAAREGEGAFAASGTCLRLGPKGRAWIGTGGTGGSRVFRSNDWGRSWQVSEAPLQHENASSGIFSIAFRDARHGIAVGGDYTKPSQDRGNVALTADGGQTWVVPGARPAGFRSAVMFLRDALLAVGTSGTDLSRDGGQSWTHLSDAPLNAMSFANQDVGWAVGPKGTIRKFTGVPKQ